MLRRNLKIGAATIAACSVLYFGGEHIQSLATAAANFDWAGRWAESRDEVVPALVFGGLIGLVAGIYILCAMVGESPWGRRFD